MENTYLLIIRDIFQALGNLLAQRNSDSFYSKAVQLFQHFVQSYLMNNGSGCNDLSGYAPSACIKLRKIKAVLWLPVNGSVNSLLLIRSAIWSSCGCWLCMPLLLFIASCRIYIYIIAFCPKMSIPVLVFSICLSVKYLRAAFPVISHDLTHSIFRGYADQYMAGHALIL